MLTVLEIIKRTTEFLASRGIASPRLNAELLLGHVIDRRRMQLYLEFERPLTAAELDRLRPLVRRRGQQEPLQYVLGETEFRGLRLKVDRRALIPRPETELLVELVREWSAAQPPVTRALDLGTGSGAIAAALATLWPAAAVVAAERCPEALALARENFAALGLDGRVQGVAASWFEGVPAGPYDVIVSNPPYLTAAEVAAAAPEVRQHEPRGSCWVTGSVAFPKFLGRCVPSVAQRCTRECHTSPDQSGSTTRPSAGRVSKTVSADGSSSSPSRSAQICQPSRSR